MYIDEKIAMLERYHRQTLLADEKTAENQDKEEGAEAEPLTLEEALLGIRAGELELRDGTELKFETRIYFEKEIPVILFKDFYQASEELEGSATFVNHDHEISQVVSYLKNNIRTISMKQWENLLVNGMAANGLYAKVIKSKSMECMEYLCYDVPSKKGWIYNVMFRMKGKDKRFTGNYNCLKEECNNYGVVLEAMVLKMNEWFREQEVAD